MERTRVNFKDEGFYWYFCGTLMPFLVSAIYTSILYCNQLQIDIPFFVSCGKLTSGTNLTCGKQYFKFKNISCNSTTMNISVNSEIQYMTNNYICDRCYFVGFYIIMIIAIYLTSFCINTKYTSIEYFFYSVVFTLLGFYSTYSMDKIINGSNNYKSYLEIAISFLATLVAISIIKGATCLLYSFPISPPEREPQTFSAQLSENQHLAVQGAETSQNV